MTERRVIFDHLEGADPAQVRFLSSADRRMVAEPWWREVPEWTEPAPVAG